MEPVGFAGAAYFPYDGTYAVAARYVSLGAAAPPENRLARAVRAGRNLPPPPGYSPVEAPPLMTAFADLYAPVHLPFTRYCAARCLGVDAGTLDDVVQDAVLAALQRPGPFATPEQLLAYLIGVAKRQLRDRLRHRVVRERYLAERRRALAACLPADPDAAVELALVLEAVDRLPAPMRDVLLLRGVSDLSLREIAEQQGCTEAAAKVRLHRARKRLRGELTAADVSVDLAAALALLTLILAA